MNEWRLALNFLFSKRRGKFLSVAAIVAMAGMAFGVASLLIALSVIGGFQRDYKKAILGFNSHLLLMRSDEITDPERIAEKISQYGFNGTRANGERFPFGVSGCARGRSDGGRGGRAVSPPGNKIIGWTPFLYREGMAVSGSRVKGIVLKGVDFDKFSRLSGMRFATAENPTSFPAVVLGKGLAEELGGTEKILRVLFPREGRLQSLGSGSVQRFWIAGTFESGLYEYDASFAFIALPEAKRFFRTDGVSGLEIWLEDPDRADAYAEAMRRDFEFPYQILTWRELNETIFRALEVEKAIFGVLLTVLVAVASLNILGTLLMLFLEKRGAVAILRAVGFPWRRLRKIFLFDGLLIGSLGIAAGMLLGGGALWFLQEWRPIPLAPEIYFLSHVPVAFSWKTLGGTLLAAFGIVWIGSELALRGITRVPVLRALLEK